MLEEAGVDELELEAFELLAPMEASMLLVIEPSPAGFGLVLLAEADTVVVTTLVFHAPAPWPPEVVTPEG